MPLKWFHRRSSTEEDEATRSSTETVVTTKQKAKRTKPVTQRSRRSHSQGSGFRAFIGLGGSTQLELDASAAIAAEEEQRRISYQTKTRRRFTVHGLSYHHSRSSNADGSCNSTPAGSPSPLYPSDAHSRHFGFGSSRMPHGHRSPRAQQMLQPTTDSHPSIIFIDCPP